MAHVYTVVEGKHITTSPVGQARLLQNWFNTHKKGTVKDITDGINKDLITRQDPMKVVMFYMGYLRKKGIIRLVAERETIEVPKVETVKKEKKEKVPKVKGLENLPVILNPTTEVTETTV